MSVQYVYNVLQNCMHLPRDNVQLLYISRATVVQSYNKYWKNILSPVVSVKAASKYHTIGLKSNYILFYFMCNCYLLNNCSLFPRHY